MKPLAALALAALAACGKPAIPAEPPSEAGAPVTTENSSVKSGHISQADVVGEQGVRETVLTSLTDPRQSGPYAPRDDCGELDGAYAFQMALSSAVLGRDTDALVALADPEIKLDFGGAGGRDEFRRELTDPGWNLWPALEALLPLGCAANSQGGITLPWYFAQDFGELDGYSAMIVTGENVPVRAGPNAGAPLLERLSWESVELDLDEFDGELGPLARVKTRKGVVGYIASNKLRSLIDYRLIARFADGKWKITALVAGD